MSTCDIEAWSNHQIITLISAFQMFSFSWLIHIFLGLSVKCESDKDSVWCLDPKMAVFPYRELDRAISGKLGCKWQQRLDKRVPVKCWMDWDLILSFGLIYMM